MVYYMIDPPVTPYDSVRKLREWIGKLRRDFPQDNEQVKDELQRAQEWLEKAEKREAG